MTITKEQLLKTSQWWNIQCQEMRGIQYHGASCWLVTGGNISGTLISLEQLQNLIERGSWVKYPEVDDMFLGESSIYIVRAVTTTTVDLLEKGSIRHIAIDLECFMNQVQALVWEYQPVYTGEEKTVTRECCCPIKQLFDEGCTCDAIARYDEWSMLRECFGGKKS